MRAIRYLVISAELRMRITSRFPNLRADEIAIPLRFDVPDGWGRAQPPIDITLPDFAPTAVEVSEAEFSVDLADPAFDKAHAVREDADRDEHQERSQR